MSRTQWFLALLLVVGGILLQIPNHDTAVMDHRDHAGGPPSGHESIGGNEAEEPGPYHTVVLEVTGMT